MRININIDLKKTKPYSAPATEVLSYFRNSKFVEEVNLLFYIEMAS